MLFQKIKEYLTANALTLVLLACTGVGITICGVLDQLAFWRMLPLYISLFVMLLSTRVNRYGLLLGSLNSLLYMAVYIYYGQDGMVVTAVVSFTVQILSFIQWSRRSYANSTVLRRMSRLMRVLLLTVVLVICAIVVYFVYVTKDFNAVTIMDGILGVMGFVVPLLQMFSFMEYAVMSVVNMIINLFMYILIVQTTPEQSAYLVYTVYCLICVILAAVRVHGLYHKQKAAGLTK